MSRFSRLQSDEAYAEDDANLADLRVQLREEQRDLATAQRELSARNSQVTAAARAYQRAKAGDSQSVEDAAFRAVNHASEEARNKESEVREIAQNVRETQA